MAFAVSTTRWIQRNVPPPILSLTVGYRYLFPTRPLPWVFSENTEPFKTISLTVVSAVLFPSQWTKEESSRSQITAPIPGSQRMAKGSAPTSGAFPCSSRLISAWLLLMRAGIGSTCSFFSHQILCYSLKCNIRLSNRCYVTLLYLSRLFKQNFFNNHLIFSSTPTVICQKQRFSSCVLKFWFSGDFKMDWSGTDASFG